MKQKTHLTIGVCFVNFNNFDPHTQACIESLMKMDYEQIRIYIVDNKGPDPSEPKRILNYAKQHPKMVVDLLAGNYGYSKAINVALKHAYRDQVDFIWCIGNDTVVRKDAISTLLAAWSKFAFDKKQTLLTSMITYHDSDKLWYNGLYDVPWLNFMRSIDKGVPAMQREQRELIVKSTQHAGGCSLFFAREFLDSHAYMDENCYFYFEDPAFSLGAKNYVLQKALVRHKVSSALGFIGKSRFAPFQAFWYVRSAIVFYFTHKRISILEQALYLGVTIWVIALLYIRDLKTFLALLNGVRSGLAFAYFGINDPRCEQVVKFRKSPL